MSNFPPASIQCDRHKWEVGTEIASGGFGRVFSATSNGFDSHVVKFIPKVPGAQRELLFPEHTDLENVVPVVDSGESDMHWVIVMPRAEKPLAGLLSSLNGVLSVDTVRVILEDIAMSLVSMKERGVVHRDIKPENILLLDDHWCLADFGIFRYAAATTAEDTRKYAWTPPYAAPEQWRGERATNATDVYAFGVVAYQLCVGEIPFSGPEIHHYRQQHLEELPKPIEEIPRAMASLVENCLMKSPSARPAPDTILSGLRRSPKPQSVAESSLQAVNARVARRRSEKTRNKSAEQSKWEWKDELYQAADVSLKKIIISLLQQIQTSAPLSIVSQDSSSGWSIRLGQATLSVAPVSREDRIVKWDDKELNILAFSNILLHLPPNHDRHEGRSHSLWYFQEEDGGFRWYELAFTYRLPLRSNIDPFALPPDSEYLEFILSRGACHETTLKEHPRPIDQANETDFIERWMEYFAQGANQSN